MTQRNKKRVDLTTQTDEQLLLNTDHSQEVTDYLLNKYKNLVRKHANVLFLIGGDTDDLIQEGMIGLFKAIRDFDTTQDVTFYHFAELCITRQMYSAIEKSQRKKHAPLNSYLSLSMEAENMDGKQSDWMESFVIASQVNPEQMMIDHENIEDMKTKLNKKLSSFEKRVLQQYMNGEGYIQIAQNMGKSGKSIDNAIQRIRKKVSEIQS